MQPTSLGSHPSRRRCLQWLLTSCGASVGSRLGWAEKRETAGQDSFAAVADTLQSSVRNGAFPGCAAACGNRHQVLWQGACGFLSLHRAAAVTFATQYDLASLTKIVGTTSVAVRLIARQQLSLDDPVVKWVPEFAPEESALIRQSVTVRQLLSHTSGLPSWIPAYKSATSYRETIETVVETPLEHNPGKKYRYSDLGLMLLGELLGRVGHAPLAELEQTLVFQPLGMEATLRKPPQAIRGSIAPTERIGDTDTFWQGIVHDENARAADGLTGHAGLFSNVADLAKFSQAWLRALRGEDSIFASSVARRFVTDQHVPGDSRRALGWQLFARGGSGGSLLDESAIGHTGFTGTSLWIDPARDLFLILLGNRVHPTRDNRRHLAARRHFADAVVRAVETS